MSRLEIIDPKTASAPAKALLDAVQAQLGTTPNFIRVLANSPKALEGFLGLYGAAGGFAIDKATQERIALAVAEGNGCQYCVVAHGALLRIYAKNPLVADQVAVNYRKADITPKQKAMLDFAMKVCLESGKINDADFETLRGHGFTDEDIWDIGAISAFFGLSNRMANMTSMRPNDEFFLLGRVPKK